MMIKIVPFLILTAGLVFLSGCSSSEKVYQSNKTLGAQLEDLKKARDAGAISEDEYKDGKEILMDKYN